MKALTTKEIVSLAVIAIIAPVLALGAMLAARVMVATGSERMLLALTVCGAVVGGLNGFGRRTVRTEPQLRSSHEGRQSRFVLTS
jgi:FtsH-binding integral membrane protein